MSLWWLPRANYLFFFIINVLDSSSLVIKDRDLQTTLSRKGYLWLLVKCPFSIYVMATTC